MDTLSLSIQKIQPTRTYMFIVAFIVDTQIWQQLKRLPTDDG